jgi:hypothetical protein
MKCRLFAPILGCWIYAFCFGDFARAAEPQAASPPAAGAAAPVPAKPLIPVQIRVNYLKRIMLTDGYDKVGMRDPKWDDKAREAINAYILILGEDPAQTGDEEEAVFYAIGQCMRAHSPDPLLGYIGARNASKLEFPEAVKVQMHIEAALGAKEHGKYPAMLRCQIFFRAADYAARGAALKMEEKYSGKAREFAKLGMDLLPEALADQDASPKMISILFELIGLASRSIEGDRLTLLSQAARIAEKSGVSKSMQLTFAGAAMNQYAWDARGGGWANTVTEEGWKLFRERIAASRTALEKAWELDQNNGVAATAMLTVARAQGLTVPEMETWYQRAIQADPTSENTVNGKLEFLEPKWHGSAQAMLAFGRQLLKDGKWDTGQPLCLVDVHTRLAMYDRGNDDYYSRLAKYFAAHPDAWDDVKTVFEGYLQRTPGSRYQRTRFAVIAAWCGKWKEADEQFKKLGEQYSHRFVPAQLYTKLRAQAAERATAAGAKDAGK